MQYRVVLVPLRGRQVAALRGAQQHLIEQQVHNLVVGGRGVKEANETRESLLAWKNNGGLGHAIHSKLLIPNLQKVVEHKRRTFVKAGALHGVSQGQ